MSVKETHLSGSPASVTKYVQEEKELHKSRTAEEYTTGYYSENDKAQSRWMGKGAALQGLSGVVKGADLERALSGITASGEDISKRGGHDKERRMGSDWTFSAPKAASIIGIEDERVKRWMMESVQETIEEYFAKEMTYARLGKGGAVSEFSENILFAAHLHEAARAADGTIDPQIHVHGVTPNMIQRKDGAWVSMRTDYGENNVKVYTMGDIQTAKLMRKMQVEGGYDLEARLEKDKDGREHLSFGARGISREVEETFSGRKSQINAYLKARGIDPKTATRAQKDAAAMGTRASKDKNVDAVDLKYQQRQRLRDANVNFGEIRAAADKRAEALKAVPEGQKITGDDVVKSAIKHLSEREDVFTRSDLISEAVKAGAADVDYKDILQAIDDRAGGLVRTADMDRDGTGKIEEQYTTKSAILRENEILHRAKEGREQAEPVIKISDKAKEVPDVSFTEKEINDGKRDSSTRNAGAVAGYDSKISGLEEAEPLSGHRVRNLSKHHLDAPKIRQNPELLSDNAGDRRPGHRDMRWAVDNERISGILTAQEAKQGFKFSQGQREAVALALTSSDRHLCTTGSSGAGKTTSMKVIVEQFREAGYEVIGVAPTAKAKQELESAGCDETITLASALLKQRDPEEHGKRIYIVDESGMISSKDMDAFIKKVDTEKNARDFMIGDPYQIESVASGTPFAQMMETGAVDYVKIEEVQRQRANPELLKLAQAYASGDAKTGSELLKNYITQVKVEPGQDKDEALATVAAKRFFGMTNEEREHTFFIADTNKKRHTINDQIHDGLAKEGTLGKRTAKITALDKMDMTEEAATRSEKYAPGKQDDKDADVVIEMQRDYKNADEKIDMKKGSQWLVTATDGGKLTLQNWENPEQTVSVNPVELKATAYVTREMEMRDGDKVYFRKNDKDRGVINGTLGVVRLDANGKPTVTTIGGDVIKLHDKKAEVMDYSYARTAHSVQGATDRGAVPVLSAGGSATARITYVASTRGTHTLDVITDDADKLCKQVSKYVDRQTALGESKAKLMTDMKEIEEARYDASMESGGVGDLAKKRAAQQALQAPAQAFVDMPDALDPDLGTEKFAKKVDAAMEKVAENQDAAVDSANAAATGGQATTAAGPAAEPVAETPAPVQAQPEPELEIGG